MGLRLTPDGTVQSVSPANGRTFSLQELYDHIGCDCVDIRRLRDRRWLVCDDNGHLRELPLNPAATVIYNIGQPYDTWAQIVGVVVIAFPHELD